ncbi:hypothetical protein ACFVFF_38730 [Streptomyces sp. NPDC057680]
MNDEGGQPEAGQDKRVPIWQAAVDWLVPVVLVFDVVEKVWGIVEFFWTM